LRFTQRRKGRKGMVLYIIEHNIISLLMLYPFC
jgi:hypothetical protein